MKNQKELKVIVHNKPTKEQAKIMIENLCKLLSTIQY